MTTNHVFLARQPVLDAERVIFGYELLFRGGPDRATAFDDPDAATRGVMERVLLQWGMEQVVGDRFGFINASASLIVNGLHEAMPPEGIIIEVREPEPFDDATIAAIRHARFNGYHFALDNVSRLGDLEHSELLPLASMVKIELTTTHHAEIDRLIAIARERSPGILVVAEKVESAVDFNRCVDHGFDLFQGYHLCEPEVLQRPARRVSRPSATALKHALGSDIDVEATEAVVNRDPSLAFRLLAAVNANAFGLDRNVGSLDQAIALLGVTKLRCLAELLASSTDTLDDEAELLRGAARALMAAQLLDGTGHERAGVTAALLSVTDRLYETSIGELIDELPLSDEIVDALVGGRGRVGHVLDVIRACERGDRLALEDLVPGREREMMALHAAAVDQARPATSSTGAIIEKSETPEPA